MTDPERHDASAREHELGDEGEAPSLEEADGAFDDADELAARDHDDGYEPLPPRRALPSPRTETDPHALLAGRDPLALYMRDVNRYPVLSADEQHALAERYAKTGDVEAARTLVTTNLRLVVKIAYDYRQAYKNLLDLVQEGNIGLMQAVKKYDPYKGVKLSSYAAWWIRAYMLRFILNNHRLVKLGTTQAQRKLFFNLRKEKARLSAMGIDPTPSRIADSLGVSESEVISMDRRLSAGEASLDVPIGGDEGRAVPRVELLPGGDAPVDEALAESELGDLAYEKIHAFGDTLEGRDRIVFEERLVSDTPKTLQALGDDFGVSRERVRQIERRIVDRLRVYLGEELGPSVLEVYDV
ncbi:MAG: RNA polymerase factor sigma-32 [Myxococcales bacterium]|nr:RNA polymerase factor sigma-32 [Myxococcales bacterium]